jgi:hypothetical protein
MAVGKLFPPSIPANERYRSFRWLSGNCFRPSKFGLRFALSNTPADGEVVPKVVALEPEELEGDVGATLRQKFQALAEGKSGRVAGADRRELDEIHALHQKQKPKKKKSKKDDNFSFK